ncbi:MAG TPA: tetratricopeptide repeat protein [Longimicrobiales bacterium]|nr:tetratricopeptide repeat protein [Longimicrobiales bacterium]
MRRIVPSPVPLAATVLALVLASVLGAAPTAGQDRALGALTFENSGAREAQEAFRTGVLLLHSFEYADAAAAFRRAQEIDADFALAYWGEAMTHNHPIWGEYDGEAARAVLARYAGTPPTEREALYLAALDPLYRDGIADKTERDRAYMLAMRRLHEAYPDDDEARAFYALSILGLTNGTRDFRSYMRGAAVAQPVFDRNPQHPGAAHYLIHAFDDPIHAPLGLPAARAYGASTPDAGHAQHMTSHIFVAMGMWDDVVRANVNAVRVVDGNRAARGITTLNRCGHYSSWQQYGHLMREEWGEAEAIMDQCQANQADPDGDDRGYYVMMRARQVLDSGAWDQLERWSFDVSDAPAVAPSYDFLDAYVALERGDPEPARRAVAEWTLLVDDPAMMQTWWITPDRIRIQLWELEGLLAVHEGRAEAAVEPLRRAADLEESLPMEFGPPASLKPPHELLGEVLLELGRYDEAVEAFQGSLALAPRRTPSLRGLEAAARGMGDAALADDTRRTLEEIVGNPTQASGRDRP